LRDHADGGVEALALSCQGTARTLSVRRQKCTPLALRVVHVSLNGMIHMSPAATEFMTSIGKLYIEKGCPNHKTWWFEPRAEDKPVLGELHGIRMLKMMGMGGVRWQLTDTSQQWAMANCQD